MESIRGEARRNAELATDLDNFRSRYRETTNDLQTTVTFPSGEIFSFEKNLFVLLANAEKVKFKPKWYQRPDYVSYEYYNSTIYWPLILFVNRIFSIEDFKELDDILIPPFNSILQIVKDRVDDTITDLDGEDAKTGAKYYKIFPLDERERNIIASRRSLE